MGNAKKTTALLLALVMVFSIVLNPILTANAGLPTVKPPVTNLPNVNTEKNVNTGKGGNLAKLETAARVQGTDYELKDGIKRLPAGMKYEIKPMTLDKFASFETGAPSASAASGPAAKPGTTGIGAKLPGGLPGGGLPGGTAGQAAAGQGSNEPQLDKINGIKYPPGSQIMVVFKNTAPSFAPQLNEVYVDEGEGKAYRFLEISGQNKEGNPEYVVETPELTDVFKSYTIPEQTIDLTTGNIAYIAPEFELSPESGMSRNYVAKAGVGDLVNEFVSFKQEGNKHILTLKPGVTIFEYPFEEQKKQDKEAQEKAKKEKFQGDWWQKDQSGDLRGVENTSALSVKIKVKEGTITVEDPKFHAYFDINPWTTHAVADFYFDAKATADVTLEGDLTFNKTIEKCVYGYEVDLGAVAGAEKGNKAFIGIFLVIGVEGKIHVEVRTITTGDARAGFAYRAFGYGTLPYFVGPYATFKPSSFDMSFTVSGEINVTLACVPQVGIIIWGTELGVLQIWVGFKAKAVFEASGGGGTSGAQDFKASGSIDLKAFGELVGYLIGNRYSIFYIDFPLYHGEWSVGEEVAGSGGDALREVAPVTRVTADAYTNRVEGKITFSTAGKSQTGYSGDEAAMDSALKPYANSGFVLEVRDRNSNVRYTRPLTTDANGCFSTLCGGTYNITPSDRIFIDMQNSSPVFEIDSKKFKVVGRSPQINPTVPFTMLDFNVDTFNDIITGRVSGSYTGSVEIRMGGSVWNTQADKGIFEMEYPINQSTGPVTACINFEGSIFPEPNGVTKERTLDALTINLFTDFQPAEPPTGTSEQENAAQSSTVTIPKGAKTGITLPGSMQKAQGVLDEMAGEDIAGRKIVKPTRVSGTITNKGDMGWVETLGDEYVREGTSGRVLRAFNGNVKITAISVQSALQAMLQKFGASSSLTPGPSQGPPWTAAMQAQQAMMLVSERDSSSPSGIRIKQVPTSAAKFEFNQPDVVAYIIEIEHEGLYLTATYNPYAYQGRETASLEEYMGPMRKQVTLITQERKDSIVNPADTSSQWSSAWNTQLGVMQLTQNGANVVGTLMQGGTAMQMQGTVANGVFTGSCMVPVANGSSTSVPMQMTISADGKSISFGNIGSNMRLNGLKGTKATRP